MRKLDARGTDSGGELHQLGTADDIGPMQDDIDRERKASLDGRAGERDLAGVGALVSRDMIGRGGLRVLNRELHMIQTGFTQRNEARGGDADSGRNEVCVEAALACGSDDLSQVPAKSGFSAREVDLQYTERRCFREDTGPG